MDANTKTPAAETLTVGTLLTVDGQRVIVVAVSDEAWRSRPQVWVARATKAGVRAKVRTKNQGLHDSAAWVLR